MLYPIYLTGNTGTGIDKSNEVNGVLSQYLAVPCHSGSGIEKAL